MPAKKATTVEDALRDFRETSGPQITGAVEILMASPRRDQIEALAFMVQHLVHGMNRLTAMLDHVHQLVCPAARAEVVAQSLAGAMSDEPDEDERVTHEAPAGRQ